MNKSDIFRLNERFVKDFGVKMSPSIANSDYFLERLEQYELFSPGIIEKYNAFIKSVQQNFETVDDFYVFRNNFIKSFLDDQELRQEKYGLKGNNLKEYAVNQEDIPSSDIYKDTNIAKTLISIDLKSANFQALKFFNSEIVRNCNTYNEYILNFTDFEQFTNKRIRASVFGKTCNKQIYKIEKFITRKVVDIVLKYEPVSNIYSFNSDEVVFVKTENLKKILDDINLLSKEIDIIFDMEEFCLTKINGIDRGYIKNILNLKTNEKSIDICSINPLYVPFVLAKIYNEPIKDSYLYFRNPDGLLCKMIEIPNIEI